MLDRVRRTRLPPGRPAKAEPNFVPPLRRRAPGPATWLPTPAGTADWAILPQQSLLLLSHPGLDGAQNASFLALSSGPG